MRCSWGPCVILFRHFFVLVKSGKGKDEVGTYYFQTRSDLRTPYIAGLTGGKWEDWRKEWVIATTEANERLVMPNGALTANPRGPSRLCRRSSTPC